MPITSGAPLWRTSHYPGLAGWRRTAPIASVDLSGTTCPCRLRTVTTWPVMLRTHRRTEFGRDTLVSSAGYVADELPEVGQEIDIGGSLAVVEEITTGADGKPLIVAERDADQ